MGLFWWLWSKKDIRVKRMTYGVQLEALVSGKLQKWKCITLLFIPIIALNWHLRKIYEYIAYPNKKRDHIFIHRVYRINELNLEEDFFSFFKNEWTSKKKKKKEIFQLILKEKKIEEEKKFAWFEKICDCFCRSQKAIWSRC